MTQIEVSKTEVTRMLKFLSHEYNNDAVQYAVGFLEILEDRADVDDEVEIRFIP